MNKVIKKIELYIGKYEDKLSGAMQGTIDFNLDKKKNIENNVDGLFD
jgi:hypothetical protein